jgi:hypothetical protein
MGNWTKQNFLKRRNSNDFLFSIFFLQKYNLKVFTSMQPISKGLIGNMHCLCLLGIPKSMSFIHIAWLNSKEHLWVH